MHKKGYELQLIPKHIPFLHYHFRKEVNNNDIIITNGTISISTLLHQHYISICNTCQHLISTNV